MANEDFTTYTETDPSSRITVAAGQVTVGASGQALCSVAKHRGYQFINSTRARFTTRCTNVPGAATYTETDPNSHIALNGTVSNVRGAGTETRFDFTDLARNEQAYVVSDFGTNYFDGNFTHDFTVSISGGTAGGTSTVVPWMLSNTGTYSYAVDHLRVAVNRDPVGNRVYIYIIEVSGTSVNTFLEIVATSGTWYCTVERDESVGTYGTLYLKVYSDAAKTTQVGTTKTLTLRANQDFRYRFWTKSLNAGTVYALSGYVKSQDGPTLHSLGAVAVSNSLDKPDDWTDGILMDWVAGADGTPKLSIYDKTSNTVDISTGLTVQTDYHVELQRTGKILTARIYSDAAYTTLVDTLQLTGIDESESWSYVIVGLCDAMSPSLGVTVKNLWLAEFTIGLFTDLSHFVTGTIEESFTSWPGTWTENIPAGTTMELSSGWLHLVYKSDGTTGPTATKTFTASDKNNWCVNFKAKIASIQSGHKCQLVGVKKSTATIKSAVACVVNDSGTYRWALYTYNGTSFTETLGSALNNPSLDTEYKVRMNFYGQNTSLMAVSLFVDGILAVQASGTFYEDSYPDSIVIGHSTTTVRDSYAECYIDDLWFSKLDVMRMNSSVLADDGGIVTCGNWRWSHALTDDAYAKTVKVLKSSDNGVTFSVKYTIDDYASGLDQALGAMFKHPTNGDIYIFNGGGNYGFVWADFYVYVHKSTDDGENWAKINGVSLNEYSFMVSDLFESNKILGVGRTGGSDPATNPHIKFITYDTSNDTFSVGATIASDGDIANRWPNESTLVRRASDNALICFTRWDKLDSQTVSTLFTYSVSEDNGATWSAPTSLYSTWGAMGAGPVIHKNDNYTWIVGGVRDDTTLNSNGAVTQPWLALIDLETLEIQDEFRFSYHDYMTDTGNGDAVWGGYDEAEARYFVYWITSAGLSGLYKVYLPETWAAVASTAINKTTRRLRLSYIG